MSANTEADNEDGDTKTPYGTRTAKEDRYPEEVIESVTRRSPNTPANTGEAAHGTGKAFALIA